MIIRKATIKDIKELRILNKKYFGESRDYINEINSKDTTVFVIEDMKRIIGISGLKINDWNNTGWLLNIFIHPDYRKKGLGSTLIRKVIDETKKNSLRCLIAEAPSESNDPFLFKKIGFRNCGYNDRYYSNHPGESAEFYSFDL
jgi:N-acetylglutamate synthase-like GNAT family acetyltransferase